MAITTNIVTNSESVVNLAQGQLVSDAGAAAALTINLGFNPRIVRFHNMTDRISDEWFEGMAAASSLHTVAAGTRTLELVNGITVSGSTFTVNATTLLASKSFYWSAEG